VDLRVGMDDLEEGTTSCPCRESALSIIYLFILLKSQKFRINNATIYAEVYLLLKLGHSISHVYHQCLSTTLIFHVHYGEASMEVFLELSPLFDILNLGDLKLLFDLMKP
jgi:hypothetical protein